MCETPAPRWARAVATGFGSGLLRPAPGTWGSLAGLAAWLLLTLPWAAPLAAVRAAHPGLRLLGEAAFLGLPLLMTWLAVRASDAAALAAGQEDPGWIVADEWVGVWVALWAVRWELAALPSAGRMALLLALPFAFFRLFDIWKPWPVRQIQVLPGGEGIVADDLVAGLYALVATQLFL